MNKIGLTRIDEKSLNRLMWHGRHGFVILSAWRSSIKADWHPEIDLTNEYEKWLEENHIESDDTTEAEWLEQRNKKADAELLDDIKKSGYAYSKTFGGYHPDAPGAIDSYEPSYVVYNHARSHSNDFMNWKQLKQFAIMMCGKYKQDSVYIQAPGEAPVYMNEKGEVTSKRSSKNFKFNDKKAEYYTTLKREKNEPQRFTADIQFENMYRVNGASSYVDKMRRTQMGEVFLND